RASIPGASSTTRPAGRRLPMRCTCSVCLARISRPLKNYLRFNDLSASRRKEHATASAVHHLATIDMDRLPADIGRVLARQIDIGRTQLGRLAAAAHGHLAAETFEHLRVVPADGGRLQRGPDGAGRDLVDAYLALDQLLGKRTGEAIDSALGRGVVDQQWVADER